MLAFSNDYYGFIFRATQSVELFCAYPIEAESKPIFSEDSNKFRKIIFKIVIFSTLLLLIFIRKKKYIWCQSVFLAFVIEGLLLMIERKRRNTLVSYKKHILDFK